MLHKPVKAGDRLFLIDGSGFIFRAYHALPPLTRSKDGLPIGAVSGFCNMLFKLTEEFKNEDQPTHIAIIFDASSKTFRNEIYADYKANRPPPPEDLIPQFALCRDAARAFGLGAIDMLGYEADDLIATYAKQASEAGADVRIYSSDKDLMQLIDHKITMIDPLKNKLLSEEEAFKKFGVDPKRIPFVQALAGDSVDNIPGVPGIGIKTAALLIQEYGTLDNLLENAGNIAQKKRRENMIEFADKARLSHQLVVLKNDVPVETTIDYMGFTPPNLSDILNFLTEMELNTLSKRIKARLNPKEMQSYAKPSFDKGAAQGDLFAQHESNTSQVTKVNSDQYTLITTEEELDILIEKIHNTGHFVFDLETTGLNIMQADLVGIAISCDASHGAYIPLTHDLDIVAQYNTSIQQLDMQYVLDRLKPYFVSKQYLKIAHNIKYDAAILHRYGIEIVCFDDTMLMSFVLYGGKHRHNMDALSEIYLNHTPITFEDIAGKGKSQKTFNQIALDVALKYAAEDAHITYRLWQLFKSDLITQGQHRFYQLIERKMPLIVMKMEQAGFLIDQDDLKQLSITFQEQADSLQEKIFSISGTEFNIASPKQIGDVLFNILGLESTGKQKKTATGQVATSADILEDLAMEGHQIADLILQWRSLQKLKSTYCDALQSHMNVETARVHSSFHLAGAATGRFSSSDPNLQNIPIKTAEGRQIRQAFKSKEGYSIIAADYSQIELRILAHIADIPLLKDAFNQGQDIHARTASEVFNLPLEDVTSDIRRRAKAVNFGIIYGISPFGLARQLKISQSDAKSYIDIYFQRLPQVKAYMESIKEYARQNAYVKTVFGRKIWVKDINSKNYSLRAFSERAAINAPIQGAAADSIKLAMIEVSDLLAQKFSSSKMISQIHDELIFEVPDALVDEFSIDLKKIMQEAPKKYCNFSVPLIVDIGIGKNWNQAH